MPPRRRSQLGTEPRFLDSLLDTEQSRVLEGREVQLVDRPPHLGLACVQATVPQQTLRLYEQQRDGTMDSQHAATPVDMPPPSAGMFSCDLDDSSLSPIVNLEELSSVHDSHRQCIDQSGDLLQWPDSQAMNDFDFEAMFQSFLTDAASTAEPPRRVLQTAPPTDQLLMAMSTLQAARQHGATQNIDDASLAVGLNAEQVGTYIIEEGRLRDTPHVQRWLLELTPGERAAVLGLNDRS